MHTLYKAQLPFAAKQRGIARKSGDDQPGSSAPTGSHRGWVWSLFRPSDCPEMNNRRPLMDSEAEG